MSHVELGDKVKDKITGFKGTAICRMSWITGCDRIIVQPDVGKDDKLPETQTFDEPMLIVTKHGHIESKEEADDFTGGPRPERASLPKPTFRR